MRITIETLEYGEEEHVKRVLKGFELKHIKELYLYALDSYVANKKKGDIFLYPKALDLLCREIDKREEQGEK